MQDNRWCENCGSDRGTKQVAWYLFEGVEMSFCKKCAKELASAFEGLERISDF